MAKKKALMVEIDPELKDEFVKQIPPGQTITGVIEKFIRGYVTEARSTGQVRLLHPIQKSQVHYTLGRSSGDEAGVAYFRVSGEQRSFTARFSITGTCEALLRIANLGDSGSLSPLLLPVYEQYLEDNFEGLYGRWVEEQSAKDHLDRVFTSEDSEFLIDAIRRLNC